MRITRSILTAVGGFTLASLSPVALAGSGCYGASTACNPGVTVTNSPYVNQPMGLNYAQPYDYLNTFSYNQAPQVNVMRVETGAARAPLAQAPNSYWGGCAGGVTCSAPVAQAPIMQAPVYQAPTYQAPVYTAPAAPTYSNRQYGDNVITPGVVNISSASVVNQGPAMVVQPDLNAFRSTSSYTTSTSSSYGGWDQVSGPTMIDGMMATEVFCKQPDAPQYQVQQQVQTQAYRVVRPVIAVPYPVPVECNAQNQTAQRPMMNPQLAGAAPAGRYGNSSWSY